MGYAMLSLDGWVEVIVEDSDVGGEEMNGSRFLDREYLSQFLKEIMICNLTYT